MSDGLVAEATVVAASSNVDRADEILTADALGFIAELHQRFDRRRRTLLADRIEQQARYDSGELPDFAEDTRDIRDSDWTIGSIPADLLDRRVEITGPPTRKMVVNALNSGAKVFMADFEDATAPSWANLIDGQIVLKDRWQGKLDFTDAATGKHYAVGATPAVLIVRPRGLHLDDKHLTLDGDPVAGGFADFALYLWHNAAAAIAAGSGPYFYLPKLESRHEAVLWADILAFSEDRLGLAQGTIKVTVLIETLPAAFAMDEILYALRDNIVALNCGRWDYIFSFIKRIGRSPDRLTPDRSAMTMDRAFLAAYSLRLIDTCHRRGAFAMGGMAAQIPVKDDEAANSIALAKVAADKQREVANGHDGTWVAHPALVAVATEAFAAAGPNQLSRRPARVPGRDEMLALHDGERTEKGAREAISVAVQYLAAWIGGRGAVPINNLMEDAATAEICRSQLWQWLRFGASLSDGRLFDRPLFDRLFANEVAALNGTPHLDNAARLFEKLVTSDSFEEFLTLPALKLLD